MEERNVVLKKDNSLSLTILKIPSKSLSIFYFILGS